MGSVPTRFGSREQLQRCVATLRANGLDVYLDMVEHHRSGDPGNFVFRYRGADGSPATGRFPKDPLNFVPNVPRDPNLGGPAKDDFPFGREFAPINGKPQGYVFNGLIDAADWLTRALDVQGYRLDDVKGLSTDFLFPFLTQKAMAGKFAFGEFFDGNRTLVNGWIFNPHGMRARASAFDFPLRFVLAAMCNNPGRFNMADLDHAGLAGISPLNAVTFVENHDTDLKEPVVTSKILAYAYILTSEGYPCVYYRDYSKDPNCYGLKEPIDNLIWIHEKLAAGPTQQRWKDFDLFSYERLGQPGLLVALNNDPTAQRTIEVATAFGAHTALHDYTGHAPDLVTSGAGTVRLTVPRNVRGTGYVCYSRAGIGGGFAVTTRTVTQEFEGAADLDLPPAESNKTVQPGRVWSEAETPIRAVLEMPGMAAAAKVTVEITGPEGTPLASQTFDGPAAVHATLDAKTTRAGFHALGIKLGNISDGLKRSYKLAATYTGSRTIPKLAGDDGVPTHETVGKTDPVHVGEWSAPFDLPNVPIHSHLLPDGRVLFWGRRDRPDLTLDEHSCTPQIWDPGTGKAVAAAPPKSKDGNGVNLFCSGHSFLPDGRLLVAGGHFKDSEGIDQASTYDFHTNRWTALDKMNNGRWYPSALTMADGTILVLSGSFAKPTGSNPQNNNIPQVWDGAVWRALASFPGDGSQPVAALELFPCMHVAPDGRAFMSGPLPRSWLLNTTGSGTWTPLEGNGGVRDNARRDYAPSVMYDVGKIVYIGGGNNPDAPTGRQPPTSAVETINLTHPAPAWRPAASMHFPRRQHNATLLPDGTVLVTGGTSGFGFNDLDHNFPVHQAELWDPKTREWTELASEAVDRCYHSTAVLLPDATVLSGGGGEYRPDDIHDNPPHDTHRNAQIFRPPYLFRGPRPELAQAPPNVDYHETFAVDTPVPADIARVSFMRLTSTTHTNNMNQRINFLEFEVENGKLMITSPARPQLCPPGHYMLFLLDKEGRPSEAKIVRIAATSPAATGPAAAQPETAALAPEAFMSIADLDAKVVASASGTHVVIGLTSKCPYGLGACWGGAFDALVKLDGVSAVRPIANAADSTADVYLHGDTLPDVGRWVEQIASVANGSYDFRGVEVSIRASVRAQNGGFNLVNSAIHEPITLAPLGIVEKIQFDRSAGTAKPAVAEEHSAYERLVARYWDAGAADLPVRVTGPLRQMDAGWTLHVRDFDA
jgi:hypothetical protein